MAAEEQIKELANTMWEQESRPESKDLEHYFRAKQILEEQEATQARDSKPSPPPGQSVRKQSGRRK